MSLGAIYLSMQMTGLLLMFEPGGKKGKILTFFSTFKVVSQRKRPVSSAMHKKDTSKSSCLRDLKSSFFFSFFLGAFERASKNKEIATKHKEFDQFV